MKNKKVTYGLLLVLLLVWGLILYRLFAATGANDEPAPIETVKPQKEAYNDFELPTDTTHLLLNYRDPFGLTPCRDTIKPSKTTAKTAAPLKPKPAINWNFIQYAGYIRNPASKKLVALLTINGKNEMLVEGQTKEQVKLLKNLRDSIQVGYNGKTKYIPIKTAL